MTLPVPSLWRAAEPIPRQMLSCVAAGTKRTNSNNKAQRGERTVENGNERVDVFCVCFDPRFLCVEVDRKLIAVRWR
jgi:hypothetical protein